MIRVKEFVDSDSSLAEKRVNEFLAELKDEQVINICYSSISKPSLNNISEQRSAILVVYRTDSAPSPSADSADIGSRTEFRS